MKEINFDGKSFSLVENSTNGKVNPETIFEYRQEGSLVTADYHGGSIKYGKIIARLEKDKLHMLYQCMTCENELKAGRAIAKISLTDKDKIKLSLNWEWLGDISEKGVSEYIEN